LIFLASEAVVMSKTNNKWGVEFRNGGWLSADTMRRGEGSSTDRKNAYRFSSKEEAEKEAVDWALAGGMAKLVDSPLDNVFVVCLNDTILGKLSRLKVFSEHALAVEYFNQLMRAPYMAGVVVSISQSE
jgi:hypothetical protein